MEIYFLIINLTQFPEKKESKRCGSIMQTFGPILKFSSAIFVVLTICLGGGWGGRGGGGRSSSGGWNDSAGYDDLSDDKERGGGGSGGGNTWDWDEGVREAHSDNEEHTGGNTASYGGINPAVR